MKILICDDHTLLRQNMKLLFEHTLEINFIAEAKNGKETLEILSNINVDVVLLGLNLPDMSGFVVLEKITKLWPNVRVLILSADPYEVSAALAYQKGAWCYLNLDIDSHILIEAMISLFCGKKYLLPVVVDLLAHPEHNITTRELHKKLSEREYEVMIMLAKEKSYSEISAMLFISEKTVGVHRTNLMRTMGMKKNTELTKYCKAHKLI